MTPPRRLGMLVPSSNTVAEPEAVKLLPPDGSVSLHVSRLRVVDIADSASSRAQFALPGLVAAASLLADAEVGHILWNGTAAGWLGSDWDHALVRAVEDATGIPTTTAIMAIDAALAALDARHIGLVTPYVEGLEARIIGNYARRGINVAASRRLDLTRNTAYAAVDPARIAALIREVSPGVDAVVILCTNLAGSPVAAPLSRETGVPVIDSVQAAVLDGLSRLAVAGIDGRAP